MASDTPAGEALLPPETPYIDVIFDGPPSHESGRFVEVNDASGKSINAGEWIERDDGLWALRILSRRPAPAEAEAMLNRLHDLATNLGSPISPYHVLAANWAINHYADTRTPTPVTAGWRMVPEKLTDAQYEAAKGAGLTRATTEWVYETVVSAAAPAPAASGGGECQLIETAPKDGTLVDLWFGAEREPDCYWGSDLELNEGWVADYEGGCHLVRDGDEPTHWLPRPKPPAALTPGSGGEKE